MLIAILFGLSNAHAVPVQLGQQGRLLDVSGAAVNGTQSLTFRIADSASGSNFLWEESLSVSFDNGYYSAILGANSASNPLEDSILQSTPLFLELEVNANGPLSPRQEITSTPFSRLAGSAENLVGGSADASELKIGGALVIDGSGSWVGPTMITNWVDITGVPADLADGDDDTLAGISCQAGQILAWNGTAWGCADDNGLSEAQVEAFVTNDPLNLALGSMVGGDDIVTTATDQDSFADLALNCQNGDVAKYDAALGWQCGLDFDTVETDWNSLQNVPAGFADGVDNNDNDWNALQNIPFDIADGDDDSLQDTVCAEGEILSYVGGVWTCTSFQSLLDFDNDGILAWNDCDDNDPASLAVSQDQDCDGVLTANDCDDFDAGSTTVLTDSDCDGTLAVDDCDDNDPSSTIVAEDADCDGLLTADDCDDNDPVVLGDGTGSACPGQSCQQILNAGNSYGDGPYWIQPGSSPIEVYCDMTTSGGGWTLIMTTSDSSAYVYDHAVWTNTSGGSTSAADPAANQDYVSAAFYEMSASESRLALGSTGQWNSWYHSTDTARNLSNQNRMSGGQGAYGDCQPQTNCGTEPINLIPLGIEGACGDTWSSAWHRFGYVNDVNSWGSKTRIGFTGDNDSSDSSDTFMGLGLDCTANCQIHAVTGNPHHTGSGHYFYHTWGQAPLDQALQGWLWIR